MFPLRVSFPDFPPSEAVRSAIEIRAEKLEQVFRRITSCEVTVRSPHQHHAKGRIYHVDIRVLVPGSELLVTREPEKNGAHEDVYVAIRDAFQAMRRQLRNYNAKLKNHNHLEILKGA